MSIVAVREANRTGGDRDARRERRLRRGPSPSTFATLRSVGFAIPLRFVPRPLALAVLLSAGVLEAQLTSGAPATAGLSPAGLQRAAGLLEAEVESGGITAASIVVARRNTVVLSEAFGKHWPELGSAATIPDSIFLLASITKPVTACAVMILVDRGLVSLDDPVEHYLPEFKGGERSNVLVRHILSHISGLPSMLPENRDLRRANAPLRKFVEGTVTTPLIYQPGTQYRYQSLGLLLAGEIVERVTGSPLREFLVKEIFRPLGMTQSALGLGAFKIKDTVWVKTSPGADLEDLRRYGANTPYWRDIGHPWGGMHSSATDLAILMQMMLNEGEYDGRRVLSRAAVRKMTQDQNCPLAASYGLGWALATSPGPARFGELASPSTFGHTGATGTVVWADPERDLLCVILTNYKVDGGRLLRRVSNAVSAAVVNVP